MMVLQRQYKWFCVRDLMFETPLNGGKQAELVRRQVGGRTVLRRRWEHQHSDALTVIACMGCRMRSCCGT